MYCQISMAPYSSPIDVYVMLFACYCLSHQGRQIVRTPEAFPIMYHMVPYHAIQKRRIARYASECTFKCNGLADSMAEPTLDKKESQTTSFEHDIKDVNEFNDVNEKSDEDLTEHRLPTDEERATLRLVSASVPWSAYAIAVVEFAERASYYGCSGLFNNFIQRPLPKGGNGAGATPAGTQLTPGALGLGLKTATGITTTFSFLAYVFPILGGIIADTKWGRYKTICVGTAIGAVAHVILLVAGIPSVIHGGHAIAPFIISILILALGTGLIKASVAPLMADQAPIQAQRVITLKTGERVILDPGVTTQNIMLIYYWSINVGAFLKLGTTYAEKRIGFWLAFLVPLIVYVLMPLFLILTYKSLVKLPPQGSVVYDTIKVGQTVLSKGGLKGAIKGGDEFWNVAKPSAIAASGGLKNKKAGWVKWDDDFVDEIRRTFKACKLFAFLPIFYLADGGLGTIQTSQAGSLTTNGAPNDLLSNFNPLTIIVMAPVLNYGVYPLLRKLGIKFSPIRRIVAGFLLGAATMLVGGILQWRVYETSPCGYYSTNCKIGTTVSPLSVWAQLPLYCLPATGELLVNITSYEIAYTRAPQRMKGLIFAIVLFMNSLSSALVLIISPSFADPDLIWPFAGIGGACVLSAFFIWLFFRKMDDEEGEVVAIGTDRPIDGRKVNDSEK
ncbi:Peptide transporter PTR2 [Hypsizygus marmoreus]|uniref:Peptide transporter PTR2 n=1 Tax=Hypsizygus marmoreus TaxID=39966 RepID=A0A369J288_HYPMA|nr:Peptide transporter PTR2 [Hypsizygus marmoreus]